MEKLILDALAARPGGDVVTGKTQYGKVLSSFRLADGVHHIKAVVNELARAHGGFVQPPPREFLGMTIEQRGYIEQRWLQSFYRAWRRLADRGVIEFPGLVPLAEDTTGRAMLLADGLFINRSRRRRYAKLAQNPINRF